MKLLRITIAFAAAALLAGGCVKSYVEQGGGDAIGFRAGSMLLQDDADYPTKASTMEADFRVFGRRNATNLVFNGDVVTYSAGAWTYSPLRFWWWDHASDYYDFVGAAPVSNTAAAALQGDAEITTVKVPYNASSDSYDLVMAATRILGTAPNPRAPVELEFNHMLSKVSVVVENTSDSPQALHLDNYYFRRLVTSGNAKASFNDLNQGVLSWSDIVRANINLGSVSPDTDIAAAGSYPGASAMMIPQRLDTSPGGAGKPQLVVNYRYTPVGESVEETKMAEIDLDTITRTPGGSDAIVLWEKGVHYTYTIRIRIGGDVRVNIVTTEWDVDYAETPGLLI